MTVSGAPGATVTVKAYALKAGYIDSAIATFTYTILIPGGSGGSSGGLPAITGINPASGPLAGGTTVSISGSNLSVVNAVYFGGSQAAGFTLGTATAMTAVSPAGSGSVHLVVYSPDGASATSAASLFTYQASAAELANQSIATARGLIPAALNPVEGVDASVLDMLNAISGMSATGVTLSVASSANSQVALSGAITYGPAAVTGNVTIAIAKAGGATDTRTVSVTAPAHVIPRLAKPAKPALANGVATWTAVANANSGYSLQLYKDNAAAGAPVMVAHGAPLSHCFASALTTPGNYTVTVIALASGAYADSPASDPQVVTAAAPVLTAAATNTAGTRVVLTFDKAMANPDGQQAQFGLTVNGAANPVTAASLNSADSAKIELALTNPVFGGEVLLVSYTAGAVLAADSGSWPASAARR